MTTTTTDTNLTQLVIHELTKAEYEALTPVANQLYLTPDESLTEDDLKTINGSSIVGSGDITITGLPSQTSQSGKFLTTNGTTASWAAITIPTKVSDLTDDTATYPVDKADYATSAGSAISATTATKLGSTDVGSATQPIFLDDGTATACTYSLNKTVPSDAIFTDTTYSDFVGATGSAAGTAGLVPAPSSGETSKYLKSDGTWSTVDSLPSQTSQSGKFLTTNGTTASWANIPTEIPSQSGQSGKFLTTNGTSVSWGSAVTFKDWRTQCTMTISVTNSSSYTISAFVIDGTNYLNELVEAGMSTTGSSSNISLSVPQGSATSTYKVVYNTSSEATGTIDISGSTATLSVSLT